MLSHASFQRWSALALVLASLVSHSGRALANSTPQALPYAQDWSDTAMITADNDWSGVPGIEGFLGQDLTTAIGADPQTLTGVSANASDMRLSANETSTAVISGAVAEYELENPTIAMQGSGTADAPYVLLHLNTTGWNTIHVAYNLRDIDGGADKAVQQVALQYRVGTSGSFVNVPDAYVADATTGNDASQVSPIDVVLPIDAENQPEIQVRVITTNAVGSDEWVGVDDILVTGTPIAATPTLAIDAPGPTAEGSAGCAGGSTTITFAVKSDVTPVAGQDIGFTLELAGTGTDPATPGDDVTLATTTGTIAFPESTAFVAVPVACDDTAENDESFSLTLTAATNATIGTPAAIATIVNDDQVAVGDPVFGDGFE